VSNGPKCCAGRSRTQLWSSLQAPRCEYSTRGSSNSLDSPDTDTDTRRVVDCVHNFCKPIIRPYVQEKDKVFDAALKVRGADPLLPS
jgi:hypothetical protein